MTAAASSREALSTSDTQALAAAMVAPQPSASKVTRSTRPPRAPERDSRDVAAGRSARAADRRARRDGPAAAGVVQVLLERVPVHNPIMEKGVDVTRDARR